MKYFSHWVSRNNNNCTTFTTGYMKNMIVPDMFRNKVQRVGEGEEFTPTNFTPTINYKIF